MISLFQSKSSKHNEVIEALEKTKSLFENVSISMAQFDSSLYNLTNYNAVFVTNQDIELKIPSDKYLQVADGVFDRLVLHKDDIINEQENEFRDKLNYVDFDKNNVVFVKFDNGAKFKLHVHDSKELIYCLQGSYLGNIQFKKENFDLEIYREGDIQIIDENQPHLFYTLSKGFALIELEKKIK